jgi:hypothetical protein
MNGLCVNVYYIARAGFTVKLMKLKLQGPITCTGLFPGPGRDPSNAPKCPKPYSSYERNLIEVFPNLTTILKIYMPLPMSCETERNFSKLSTITSISLSNTLQEILNYVSILPTENYIIQWLSYEEAIGVCSQNM